MDDEKSREGERERGKERSAEEKGRRRNGTGECSLEPITVARPGVRQTLYSFSNNANKRASILRFYRAVLSVFDNRPSGQRRSRALRPPSPKRCRSLAFIIGGRRTDFNEINGTRFCPRDSPRSAECAMFLRSGVQAFPIPIASAIARFAERFVPERVFTLDNRQPNFYYGSRYSSFDRISSKKGIHDGGAECARYIPSSG